MITSTAYKNGLHLKSNLPILASFWGEDPGRGHIITLKFSLYVKVLVSDFKFHVFWHGSLYDEPNSSIRLWNINCAVLVYWNEPANLIDNSQYSI